MRQHPKLPPMTEAQLQQNLLDALRRMGWWAWHVQDSRGMESGLLDTEALHPELDWLIHVECKREGVELSRIRKVTKSGREQPSQQDVFEALKRVKYHGVYKLWPSEWDWLMKELQP